MKGNVSTGFAFTLIALFALVFGTVFWLMGKENINDAPMALQTINHDKQQQTTETAPQSDETEFFPVVYENKEFGFSLELPASWKGYRIEQVQGGYKILLPTQDKEFRNESTMPFDGISYAGIANLYLEDVNSWEYRQNTPDCKLHPGSSTLDCPDEKKVIARTNNTIFYVDLSQAFPSDFDVFLPSQTSIVSATDFYNFVDFFKKGFKIIEQTSIDTSDWQTYRNNRYGFEVEIPKEWKEMMPFDGSLVELRYDIFECKQNASLFVTVSSPNKKETITFSGEEWLDVGNHQCSFKDLDINGQKVQEAVCVDTVDSEIPGKYNYHFTDRQLLVTTDMKTEVIEKIITSITTARQW